MSAITNILTVSVPSIGKLPLAEKPGTFTPSGKKREHKAGRQAEDGGFTSSETPAKLDLNLNLTAGTDVDALNAIEGENVTIRLSDGAVYMMPLAFRSGEPVGVGDGEAKLVLMSNTSERI